MLEFPSFATDKSKLSPVGSLGNIIFMRELRQLFIIGIGMLLFIFMVSWVSAETVTSKQTSPVAFRVEVGDLVCKTGFGTASVFFVTEPKEGGYFEIIGGTIDKNEMTLDRRVAFKSGTYTWKGIPNSGFHEVPPSIGEFIIHGCSVSPQPVVSLPIKKSTTDVTKGQKEAPKIIPIENISNDDVATVSPVTTDCLFGSTSTDCISETEQWPSIFNVLVGLIILGFTAIFFGWKKGGELSK